MSEARDEGDEAEIRRQAMIIAEDRATMTGEADPPGWARRHCAETRFRLAAAEAVASASARRLVWTRRSRK